MSHLIFELSIVMFLIYWLKEYFGNKCLILQLETDIKSLLSILIIANLLHVGQMISLELFTLDFDFEYTKIFIFLFILFIFALSAFFKILPFNIKTNSFLFFCSKYENLSYKS